MIAHWSQAGYETAMVCGNACKKGSLYKYGKRVKKKLSLLRKKIVMALSLLKKYNELDITSQVFLKLQVRVCVYCMCLYVCVCVCVCGACMRALTCCPQL